MNQTKIFFLLFAASIACATAQQQAPEKPFVLANDKLELTISPNGARLERVMIKDGPPLSPLATMGHFLALDGFGTPSDQELAAGMPFHGEANHQLFRILSATDSGSSHSVTMQATLPLAQETLTQDHRDH